MVGLAETNLAWHMLLPRQRLRERTWGWFQKLSLSSSYAFKFTAIVPFQVGGTATLAINDCVHRVTSMEYDQTGMGRLSSIQLRGKNQTSIRLITAYRCVKNIHGPLSAWNQQHFILDSNERTEDPIEAFDMDLIHSIKKWLSLGDQVILGIDVNEDVRSGSFARRLRAECRLQEINVKNYGNNLPNTYARGSNPIDGLFVSQSLSICPSGYTEIICDHRMLWMDIPVELALGYIPLATVPVSPRRLILQDPRIVKRYNQLLQDTLEKQDVLNWLHILEQGITGNITAAQIREYDLLDSLRIQATICAQKRCRKLRMGAVPFSPQLCLAGKKNRAWKLILKKKSGGSVHTSYLQRKLKEAGITDTSLLTISEIQENLRNAWQRYRTLKKRAAGDRSTWIEELAAACAEEGKSSIASEIKNIMLREMQRRDARIIKNANADQQRMGLSMLKTREGDTWVEITEKSAMESALFRELRQRFNQAKSTPFCVTPLFEEIGSLGISR
jgi:hypothetical protein